MPKPPQNTEEFASLVEVVAALRGPEGCPWDKEQTHQTLAQFAIEEAHEFAEAADQGDRKGIVEELGDMLLQVILNAEIGRQESNFTLKDVISGITEKMIRRHPHVFDDLKVKDAQDVLNRWGDLKAKEKPKNQNPFASIPKALPALQRADKIGAKTRTLRFDWSNPDDVFKKVYEEIEELKQAINSQKTDDITHELGDVLFSVAQLARHLNVDPEQALRMTNHRFEQRFMKMRQIAEHEGTDFTQLSENQLEELWKKAKKSL